MRRIDLLTIAIGLIVSLWAVTPARADYKTYVSGTGSNANPCTRDLPCATFPVALAATNANGEIICIDAPDYPVPTTISKSVTIDCTGVAATLPNSGVIPAITINLPPGDVSQTVRLRGFSINGLGVGARGISIVAAKTVILEDMEITNETQQGIADVRTTGGLLLIKNSVIAKNTGAGLAIAVTGGPYVAAVRFWNRGK